MSESSSNKAQSAFQSLSSIITHISIPPSQTPASYLLHDPEIASQICTLLRQPDSGAGDNNLCRWLYDTFQSSDPELQLVVLRFLPIIAGAYLSRVTLRKPLAGFEAVLLALYAHETTARNGQSITVSIPDLTHPSIYHESKTGTKTTSTDLNIAVISPSLEPHGTVRSTKRARIVGVALELYFSKISQLPIGSKVDFCKFCEGWAGLEKDSVSIEGLEKVKSINDGAISLPWELLQPALRILGHCLLGPKKNKELCKAASAACRRLHARALHDINPTAILATGSLVRLGEMALDSDEEIDHTEITMTNVISL